MSVALPEVHGDPVEYWWTSSESLADSDWAAEPFTCPFGDAGAHLAVREAYRSLKSMDAHKPSDLPVGSTIFYEVDGAKQHPEAGKYRYARFMCRWMVRLHLKIVRVRVERLHDITDEDVMREGIVKEPAREGSELSVFRVPGTDIERLSARAAYFALWDMLHGLNAHEANPWVWVIDFVRV